MGTITVGAAVIPAFVATDDERRLELGVLLPTAMAGILLISVVSAIASGGGRELVSREQGVAFPISPTTDHLGALLLAPLNISWLIQAWGLLGRHVVRRRPRAAAHRPARDAAVDGGRHRRWPRSSPGASRPSGADGTAW